MVYGSTNQIDAHESHLGPADKHTHCPKDMGLDVKDVELVVISKKIPTDKEQLKELIW